MAQYGNIVQTDPYGDESNLEFLSWSQMPNAKSLNFFFNKRYFRNIRFLFTQLKNKHDCFAQSLEKDELVKFYRLLGVNENETVKKYSPGLNPKNKNNRKFSGNGLIL